MQKYLFLVCPTDCLEHTINKTFKYENFFYTSLGNSFIYDSKTIDYIRHFVRKHHIEEIYFVLSMDNKIVSDVSGNNEFSNIRSLTNFYKDITKQKEHSQLLFQRSNDQFTVLSYFLNKKIKELESQLTDLSNHSIQIGGKIYHRDQNVFTNIRSDLVCLQKYHQN